MFIEEPKKAPLEKPGIKAEVRAFESGGKSMQFEIKLKTEKPAFYVSLEAQGVSGLFDKNMLTLLPGKAETVRFTLRDDVSEKGTIKKTRPISAQALQRALRITSLRDTYR